MHQYSDYRQASAYGHSPQTTQPQASYQSQQHYGHTLQSQQQPQNQPFQNLQNPPQQQAQPQKQQFQQQLPESNHNQHHLPDASYNQSAQYAYSQPQQQLQQQQVHPYSPFPANLTNNAGSYGQPPQPQNNQYQQTNAHQQSAQSQYGQQQQQQYVGQHVGYQNHTAATNQLANNFSSMTLNRGFNSVLGTDGFNVLSDRNIKFNPKITQLCSNWRENVIRCTLNKVPDSASVLQKSRLPFGLLLHPFKKMDMPVIQDRSIVRCKSCRAYINPYIRFIDHGRWQCNLCHRINDLPDDFFLDPNTGQQYMDYAHMQPELTSSSVEFVASVEYMVRPPQPAAYLFVFDCSAHAFALGYVPVLANVILDCLNQMPGDTRTLVGFIGFNSNIHFFNLIEQVSQMVVPDIEDAFIPSPESLLVPISQNYDNIVNLLTTILPNLPNDSSTDSGSALGPALSVAYKLISPIGGRITLFQTTLPNKGGNDGSVLKSREDPNQRMTSAESTKGLTSLLNPVTDYYKKLALEYLEKHVTVDIFNLCPSYSDIATVGQVAKISGGSIFYYGNHGFNMNSCPERVLARFEADLEHYLCRNIGFEAVMRLRCTRGLSIHTFHGNFFVRSTDLLALPNCNPDSGYAIQISIDEELKDFSDIAFQVAVLYTSATGERRIRVHTISLPIVATIHEILNNADQEAIMGLLCKMATDRTLTDNLGFAREALVSCAIDVFQTFKLLNPLDGAGGLVTSYSTALLPLYISALLKHVAFRVGISTKIDDRVNALEKMKTLPLNDLLTYIYPNLYPLHLPFNYKNEEWPSPLQLSYGNIDRNGAYLLDTYDTLILYVCKAVSQEFLQSVFGVDYFTKIPDHAETSSSYSNGHATPTGTSNTMNSRSGNLRIPKPSELIKLEINEVSTNKISERVNAFIVNLLINKSFKPHFFIIREDSPSKFMFLQHMYDDRSESSFSYYEFLHHIQQQIKGN